MSESYYTQKGQLLGEWHGKLAAHFGLSGNVNEAVFNRLANGQDPHTGHQLIEHRDTIKTKTGEEIGHRAAWDLTFAPPKSVSQTALVGADERVREAHRDAVKVALGATESYVQARLGGDHLPITTGNWVAALFEHDTSRPVDGYAAPQLHTHVVMFNMTMADKIRSIDPKELYRVQSMSTAIYRAELAVRLQEMGYELEHRRGHSFEIKGYSQAYLDADSARRREIVRRMDELGLAGAESAERVSHQTRDKKEHLTAEQIRSMHRAMATEFGNQPDRVVASAHERGVQRASTDEDRQKAAHKAMSFAKHRLIERSAVFDEYELTRDALHYGQGVLRLTDVQKALVQRTSQERGEFIEIHHHRKHAPGHRYTTAEMIEMERKNIEMVRFGIDTSEPIASQFEAKTLDEKYSYLNTGQRNLVLSVFHSTDKVVGVQGGAGTGKTTALRPIRELAEEMGFETRGLAPTSRAARELRDVGLETETLQRNIARSTDSDTRRKLYFVDESSLASTKQIHTLLSRLRQEDRVLLIGDTRQHQCVEAGRIFYQLQNAGMSTFRLDQIVRQKNEELREVVQRLAKGDVSEALDLLGKQGRIHEYENRHQRVAAIAKTYADAPHNSLVVSPDNASRQELNLAIRKELQHRGVVAQDVVTIGVLQSRQGMTAADRMLASSYNENDIIRFQRDNAEATASKGSYGTVLHVDSQSNRLTVEMSDRRIVTYDPRRAYGVQVYVADFRTFAIDDRIQFTNPWNEQKIANRDIGVITALDTDGNVSVRLEEKSQRSLSWNLYEMRHIDYAYAMTSYSAQGTTVDRVLIHVDVNDSKTRHLVDQSLAYVAGSRSRHDLELFTDNKEQLNIALSRSAIKPTALSQEQTAAYAISQENMMAHQA